LTAQLLERHGKRVTPSHGARLNLDEVDDSRLLRAIDLIGTERFARALLLADRDLDRIATVVGASRWAEIEDVLSTRVRVIDAEVAEARLRAALQRHS
jgi:hypothetical protein